MLEILSTVSIGIANYPKDGEKADTLLMHAHLALDEARKSGGDQLRCYSQDLSQKIEEKLYLAKELRQAIENNELMLYFQPKLSAEDQKVIGYEVLSRWQHRDLGWIRPDKFIEIAEETGLICNLGAWAIRESCRQLSLWKDHEFLHDKSIAINVSVHQLNSETFVNELSNIIEEYQVNTDQLELEVTETVAMSNPQLSIKHLYDLHQLGLKIAIDDFGTGYSSLAYLNQLPVQLLKLDRAFVQDIEIDENNAAISEGAIKLAHSLGLKVVAEGIETEQQKLKLDTMGCDFYQGYFYGKPVPVEQILELAC